MSLDDIRQRLESLARVVFAQEGMDLIELKVSGHKNDVLIQIIADKPSGGINIRECAILNKALAAAIEQAQVPGRLGSAIDEIASATIQGLRSDRSAGDGVICVMDAAS